MGIDHGHIIVPHTSKASKLPEGWINTEKYGPVFVSPGGISWSIHRSGTRLDNIAIKLSTGDVIEKSAEAKLKHARAVAQWRKSKVAITKAAILTAGVVVTREETVAGPAKLVEEG